ncbi:hypothetical protein EVAR_99311_1 [Eumeta japonica]|uniref:Uncharacterized protein n=1 Tax=Eumeta variegata TaxID=151549 RepID=A0A4C1YUF0_EUMVA|nr:hypothetical protein EVAR_99311_1 [Eumeta japonica]
MATEIEIRNRIGNTIETRTRLVLMTRSINIRDEGVSTFYAREGEAACEKYPFLTQEAGNALAILLGLRVSMGGSDYLLSDDSLTPLGDGVKNIIMEFRSIHLQCDAFLENF